ncbi:hypothetical protein IE4803_PB00388 (plasmid) [Rhizobium etli bv. phaseoli str. IE4803]|nr:hypothetical protein IE4803_PB00388 [Rhizobium etli bv. phaseoli str. IE4803]ARQ60826.1 hypothetical protein Kim5_PA00360 [Rhizobium sp. Kim5]
MRAIRPKADPALGVNWVELTMHVGACIMPACQCARSHTTVSFASITIEPMLLTFHEVTLPIDPA